MGPLRGEPRGGGIDIRGPASAALVAVAALAVAVAAQAVTRTVGQAVLVL